MEERDIGMSKTLRRVNLLLYGFMNLEFDMGKWPVLVAEQNVLKRHSTTAHAVPVIDLQFKRGVGYCSRPVFSFRTLLCFQPNLALQDSKALGAEN